MNTNLKLVSYEYMSATQTFSLTYSYITGEDTSFSVLHLLDGFAVHVAEEYKECLEEVLSFL